MKKKIIVTAAVLGAIAVIAGAFGAHWLQGALKPKNLSVWQTAVQYQFYHVLALLFLATLTRYNLKLLIHCYYLFTIGSVLFSGSLYLLACSELTGWSWVSGLSAVTPLGGTLLVAGWVTLTIAALKLK